MAPKVSVVMSVHNGERFLAEAVESVLHQGFQDFEFIIYDDASTDGTPALLAGFAARDPRIRLFRNPANLGLTRTLNLALANSTGAYIARQDADDVSLPVRLDVQSRLLDEQPDVLLVSGRIETIDTEGNVTAKLRPSRPAASGLIPWMLLFYNYLQGHSVAMFRREAALAAGGYDENYRYSQDYDLWLRLSRLGEVVVIEQMLLRLRLHDQSISRASRRAQRRMGLECSQRAIQSLTGQALALSEIRELREFWKGHFGGCGSPGRIHGRLLPIYEAYGLRGGRKGASVEPGTLDAIRRLVQKQFNLWARSTRFRHAPVRRLSAAWHGWRWRRMGGAGS